MSYVYPPLITTHPDAQVICADPFIATVDDFFSPSECRWVIKVATASMRPSVLGDMDDPLYSDFRTGQMTWLKRDMPKFSATLQRIANYVCLPLENAENLQVINYGKGQEYKAHLDGFDPKTAIGQNNLKRGGQRILTCLIYLNDDFTGGSTFFPKLSLEVKPRAGRMAIFQNSLRTDFDIREERSYHQGMPVQDGVKWAANLWFHDRTWRV